MWEHKSLEYADLPLKHSVSQTAELKEVSWVGTLRIRVSRPQTEVIQQVNIRGRCPPRPESFLLLHRGHQVDWSPRWTLQHLLDGQETTPAFLHHLLQGTQPAGKPWGKLGGASEPEPAEAELGKSSLL